MKEYDIDFKDFRKKVGLTRTQVGRELGIPTWQILLWEWNLWSPNDGVKQELKEFLVKFIERSVAAVIGTGLVATAGWLAKFAVADPEVTSKVAASLGAGALASMGGMILYFAATGETILKVKIGREIVAIPKG